MDQNGNNPQGALDELQRTAAPPVPKATCGKCGAGRSEPWANGAPLIMQHMNMGPMLVGVFYCGNPACGAVFSVQLLEMRQAAPEPKSSVIMPS